MAEWQIGHRKSSLVLSARFPVVKWRSRSVATSTYCSRRTSVKRRLGARDRSWSLLYFRFIFFCFFQAKKWSRRTKHNINGPRPQPLPTPLSLTAPKNANLVLWRWVRGGVGTQFPQNRIHPGFSPTRPYGPSERDETTLAELIHPYFAREISSLLDVLSFHVHSRRLKKIESLLAGEVF